MVDNKLNILNKKSDKLPIISSVVQAHGNTIAAMIDEDKMLRQKIRDLSDRLDFHDTLNKLICSAFQPPYWKDKQKNYMDCFAQQINMMSYNALLDG